MANIRQRLISLNPDELHYYPFISNLDRCDGSFYTFEYLFCRLYVPHKIDDANLKVINRIKGINKSKILVKHSSCKCRREFDGRKYNSKQQ